MRTIYRNLRNRLLHQWRLFWLARSGPSGMGRVAAWIVSHRLPPYHQMAWLADLSPRGFVALGASIHHPDLRLGNNVFLGKNNVITKGDRGGPIELGSGVHVYGDSFMDTGSNALIVVGEQTHIQPGCHFHAYLSDIRIGSRVEIAPRCGFYSYDHGMAPGAPIMDQPLKSKGPIIIGDGAWIGYGATVLQGVNIGEGAVIAAGAVVVRDIPAHAIAAGVPARVVGTRNASSELPQENKITPISPTGTSREIETIKKFKP